MKFCVLIADRFGDLCVVSLLLLCYDFCCVGNLVKVCREKRLKFCIFGELRCGICVSNLTLIDNKKKIATEQKKALHEFPFEGLRDMLRERGLPISGNTSELVIRLLEADPQLEHGVPVQSELNFEEAGVDILGEKGTSTDASPWLERERELIRREQELIARGR